jgi:MerR family transcriptional regulator, copper efflux regulator
MRIGELADQAGISTKAIRYYEQIGILAPPARTASGYRAYHQATLGRLGFVRAAQALGLTLGEIRQIIAFREDGSPPCAHVTELLQRRATELERRIAELQQLRTELQQLAERATTLDPNQCTPERVCHILTPTPDRNAATAEATRHSLYDGAGLPPGPAGLPQADGPYP